MADQLIQRCKKRLMDNHPCFCKKAHCRFGRIHLPVAPLCNIRCRYCDRRFDCVNESRPGVTSTVLTAYDAVKRVRSVVNRNEKITVAGIAGPGEPLANNATFELLKLVKREFPELIFCISTNGLLLSENIEKLINADVKTLTVTINAVRPQTAEKIYSSALYDGNYYTGSDAAECILSNQWDGFIRAADSGMIIKINSVLIPGINDSDILLIAKFAGDIGAEVMNIIPLIPQAELRHLKKPSQKMLYEIREECVKYIPQMNHCRQCRSDACGLLGEDKDIELELLLSKIGEVYCEMVI